MLVPLLWAAACLVSPCAASAESYLHLRLHGIVNPIERRYVVAGLERAEREGDRFVLLSVDTPGGLISSMQEIVTAITNSKVPVIGFVEPQSAQATSAGALILLATDIAAMAPGTRVGSAHPVGQGKPLERVMDEKATNSLATLAKSLAERRGRPTSLAEEMVTTSKSFTATDALEKKLIEIQAPDRSDLLRQLEGRTLQFRGRPLTLHTGELTAKTLDLSWIDRALDAIAEPTIASILVSLGVLGIAYEFASPGIGLGGIVGTVCLLFGLLGLSALPLDVGGLLLMVAGLAAVGVEVKIPSHGVVAGAGILAFVLGGLVLVNPSGYFGGMQRVQWLLWGPWVAILAVGVLLLARLARRAQKAPVWTGMDALVGRRGTAKIRFVGGPGQGYSGTVFVDGARWQAHSADEIEQEAIIEVMAALRQPPRLEVRAAENGAR